MQKIEFFIFLIINFLLTSSILTQIFLITAIIGMSEEYNFVFILLTLLLVKFLIFPVFYEVLSEKSVIKKFFQKIKTIKLFFKIILFAFIIDMLTNMLMQIIYTNIDFSLKCILKIFEFAIWCQVITIGGLATSYLPLIIWLKIKKHKN